MKNIKEIHLHIADSPTNHNFCKVHKPLLEAFQNIMTQAFRYYLEKWAEADGLGSYCLNTVDSIKALKKAIQHKLGKELLNEEIYSVRDAYGLCRVWVTRHIRQELDGRRL